MASTASLKILVELEDRVSGEMKKIQSSFEGFKGKLESMEPAFKKMAVVGTAAFAGISAVVVKSITAAGEAAEVQAQLAAVLKSTGQAAGFGADLILENSARLQQLTTYGDEAITSMQSLLLTFTNIKGPVFWEATETILDMSVALGQDLKSSAVQVGKALNDPILGVSALRKVGVNFTADQQAMIESLVDTGQTMEAQKLILKELATEFGGSASAQAQTFSGRITQLKERFGDLYEAIGTSLIPIIEKMIDKVAPILEKMIAWAEENPRLVQGIIAVTLALTGLVAVAGLLGLAMLAISVPALIVTGILAAIGVAAFLLIKYWDELKVAVNTAFTNIGETILNWWEVIKTTFENWGLRLRLLGNDVVDMWETIKEAFWTSINFIIGVWANLLDYIFPGWTEALVGIWEKTVEIFTAIQTYFSEVFTGYAILIGEALDNISAKWMKVWTALKNAFAQVWESITAIFKTAEEGITSSMDKLVKPIEKVIRLAERAMELAGGALKKVGSSIAGGVSDIIERGSSISGKAEGGFVAGGTPYLVGERGPEYFIPSQNGSIVPNRSVGGLSVTITGNTFIGKEGIARQIGDEIMRDLRFREKMAY